MSGTDRLLTKATPWLCLLIVAFAGFGVWRWEFAADDVLVFRTYTSVLADDQITTNWNRVFLDFIEPWGANPYLEYYRPLVTLSLVLDWNLFGFDAGANATVNLALHLAAALLVHRIGLRILPARPAAALAALLFAATPLAQENIAWAVGRCALSNLFALSATLVFLRRWAAGHRGAGLHAPVILLLAGALMSMESGMIWTLFPAVTLFIGVRLGTVDGPATPRELARLTWSHWSIAPLYMFFRILVLGSLGGQNAEHMLRALANEHVFLPFSLLYEALIPAIRDQHWLQNPGLAIAWHLLVLGPCAFGLFQGLLRHRVPGLGIATLTLLGFWFLSRVPSVHLPMREGLDTCRLAYYSFPPLALILGMLLSANRPTVLFGLAFVIGSALHLEHRVHERVLWSHNTVAARRIMLEEARARGAILEPGADPARTPAFAYLDQVAGVSGAPGVHPGEFPLVLYPPLVDERIQGFSLQALIRDRELASAAAIAEQLGGVFMIFGGDEEHVGPERRPVDHFRMAVPRPVAGLEPSLTAQPFDPVPRLDLGSAWRLDPSLRGAVPVLILIAGNAGFAVPVSGNGWPARAYEQLWTWRQLAGRNASWGFLVEMRNDPLDPRTTLARSGFVIGGFSR